MKLLFGKSCSNGNGKDKKKKKRGRPASTKKIHRCRRCQHDHDTNVRTCENCGSRDIKLVIVSL